MKMLFPHLKKGEGVIFVSGGEADNVSWAFTDIAERKIKDDAQLHLNQLKDSRFVIEIPCRPTCIRG